MDEGILDLLRRAAVAESEIRLLNVYQGIPVAYPANIMHVGNASIIVQSEKYQIVCLFKERETFIQFPGLPANIHCHVLRIDPQSLQAELADFSYSQGNIGDRRNVRVWPKEAITGQLQLADRIDTLSGELADISIEGMGIYLPENDLYARLFREGRKVAVVIRLPGVYQLKANSNFETMAPAEDVSRFDRSNLRYSTIHTPSYDASYRSQVNMVRSPEIEVAGVVANIYVEASTRRCRVGIRLMANEYYRNLVSQFISQRQSEIIQEINSIYRMLTREKNI